MKQYFFGDFPPTTDSISEVLSAPSDLDSTVQKVLQVVFSSRTVLVSHLLEDNLPGGVLDSPSEVLWRETASVPILM